MCMMCDGFGFDDVVALNRARIAEYGFTVIGVTAVDPEDEGVEWAYTIGLLDAAGHPELVVVGPDAMSGGRLLQAIGRGVLAGERFASGDVVGEPPYAVRFGVVDAVQHQMGTFSGWHAAKRAGHVQARRLEVLQVFAPSGWFGACDPDHQPDLADPRIRLDATGPGGRAARRSRARRARRRAHPR